VVLAGLAWLAGCTNTTPPVPDIDIPSLSATELASAIRQERLTSVEAVEHYLARIEAHNESGATLNAVLALAPDAREQAERLDRMAGNGEWMGRLHGVPVLVKDTIDVAGLPTTAGSLALSTNAAAADAEVVARLRAEGAVILGKTNLSEWSNFRSRGAPAGWSAVGGQTMNPFSPDHSPCGSSSGSAVAVAAGFAPLTLGAETNASLICPGAVNGIVAFKPTIGRLSRDGMILVSDSQDTPGPMARNVADIALAMDAMMASQDDAGPDGDLLDALDNDLEGIRIGVFRWAEGGHPGVSTAFDEAVDTLELAGAQLVEISSFEPDPVLWRLGEAVLLTEFAANTEAYLAARPEPVQVRSIAALVEFNRNEPGEKAAEHGQDILERVVTSGFLGETEHREAVEAIRTAARHGIDHLLADHDVDVLIMPASPPAAPWIRDPATAALRRNVGATWLPAMAGYPMLTVPMGNTPEGLPLGLGIVGTGGADALVLRVGHGFEQAAGITLRPAL
jgi:amidase